jgi:hypothetical protein
MAANQAAIINGRPADPEHVAQDCHRVVGVAVFDEAENHVRVPAKIAIFLKCRAPTPVMARRSTDLPLFFCSDPAGRPFCEDEAWNIGPYSQPEFVKSGPQLFQAARERFVDYRCIDLEFWLH